MRTAVAGARKTRIDQKRPKDGGRGMWAYKHIFGWEDDFFPLTPMAIDINDTRGLHAPQLVRDALRNMGKPIASAEVL